MQIALTACCSSLLCSCLVAFPLFLDLFWCLRLGIKSLLPSFLCRSISRPAFASCHHGGAVADILTCGKSRGFAVNTREQLKRVRSCQSCCSSLNCWTLLRQNSILRHLSKRCLIYVEMGLLPSNLPTVDIREMFTLLLAPNQIKKPDTHRSTPCQCLLGDLCSFGIH